MFNNFSEEKCIKESLDKFYFCTNVPVKAYRNDGNSIYSKGYTIHFESLADQFNICENLSKKLYKKSPDSSVNIFYDTHVIVTGFSICPNNLNRGIIIIGPYTTSKNMNTKDILYKPKSCIAHLITLFYNIMNDSEYIKLQKKFSTTVNYSLHIKKAIEYVDSKFYDPISLDVIAEYLNINRCYFCNLFKKETGKTFSQYLNQVRIERSKELLLTKDLPIIEVAMSVGFSSQNYYNMAFKKITKKTPLEFRNENFQEN
ncbi:AraC family transcriptional regulator [Clostridium sp. HBUAS56017]|uniref:helix-turn-helix domain-containing protein n=1 Tax=Clostridium sp. HBUAS56017 TaxID=2571128 RepID=UPI0011776FE0|nr:AraC family transcriptional regulator [Clostridium sp. HBUAS56017]